MRRGDVITVSWRDYAGKPRPAVVVQSDLVTVPDSITVCPTTTDAMGAGMLRPCIAPSADNGLREPSWIMVDKVTTVPSVKVGRRVGRVDDDVLRAVDTALLIHLGLAGDGSLAA